MANPLAIETIQKLISDEEEAKQQAAVAVSMNRIAARGKLIEKYYNHLIKLAKKAFIADRSITIEYTNNHLTSFGNNVVVFAKEDRINHILDLFSDNVDVHLTYDAIEDIVNEAIMRVVENLESAGYRRVAWGDGFIFTVTYSMPERELQ